jgi:hypothetical protein
MIVIDEAKDVSAHLPRWRGAKGLSVGGGGRNNVF